VSDNCPGIHGIIWDLHEGAADLAIAISSHSESSYPCDMPGPLPAGVDTLLAAAANSRVGREGGRERAEQSIHVASVF